MHESSLLTGSIIQNAVCCVPVSPMRLEPSHRSEMVSQQLFGESCHLTESGTDHWVKIKADYDGYEGWCQESHLMMTGSTEATASKMLTGDWLNEIQFNGQQMQVPMGCTIPVLPNASATSLLEYKGRAVDAGSISKDEAGIRQIALKFLNTSYLWGGKSVFGVDCSGFTQTVFKFIGIHLLRDAYLQSAQGDVVGFLQEARCGDLAFFDNTEGRITHVGIMLNDHEIIHSSGKVRIDRMDNEGIINIDHYTRTHQLRIIKRYF